MELADRAMVARARADSLGAERLAREAYQLERQAAETLRLRADLEPSRSVLFRSAASLALECGELGDVEKLIATAREGNPGDDLVQELQELSEEVQRRLDEEIKVVREYVYRERGRRRITKLGTEHRLEGSSLANDGEFQNLVEVQLLQTAEGYGAWRALRFPEILHGAYEYVTRPRERPAVVTRFRRRDARRAIRAPRILYRRPRD
jgi:hypothetical protein